MTLKWTKAHHGVEHCNRNKKGEYCAVHTWQTWAECVYWSKDCGFFPTTTQFDTNEEAKASAEEWMKGRE